MKALCIDTSTRNNWVALYSDGRITDCVGYEDRQSCLINLMPSIKTMLGNAQIDLSSLDAIATVTGPGAWSSLRIGAATVKQLCLVNQLPLFAVSSLDLLVATAVNQTRKNDYVLATLEAQNGKVYSGLYQTDNGDVNRIGDYKWETVDWVAASISQDVNNLLIIGDAAPLFRDHLRLGWQTQDMMLQKDSTYLVSLGTLAEMAQPVYKHEEILLFKPLYIQPSSAEVEFNVSVT